MSISLLPEGTKFQAGKLYELVYTAKNPKVTGLGFASIRDVASFLRSAKADDQNHPNPLAGDLKQVYSFCISQPCRTMRDFVELGFNETADAPSRRQKQRQAQRKAIDGVLDWIGGGSGVFANYRFAEPFRTHRQHIARRFPEFKFPFAYQTTTDAVTGKTDGLLRRCTATDTCPKIIDANSDNEYWSKSGSMLHTDSKGKRSRRRAGRPSLSDGEPAAWRRRAADRPRHLPAGPQSAGRQPGPARAAGRPRPMGHRRQGAAAEQTAAPRRRHAGGLDAKGRRASPPSLASSTTAACTPATCSISARRPMPAS